MFSVLNSYSTGTVSGFSLGGLIGNSDSETINNSYWDTEASSQATSDGGEGKTTSVMKQQSTFTNWDFDIIWEIDEGNSYLTLRWQTEKLKEHNF